MDIKMREAVFQSLQFQQPDVCPYYIWVSDAMAAPLAEKYGAEQFIGPAGVPLENAVALIDAFVAQEPVESH